MHMKAAFYTTFNVEGLGFALPAEAVEEIVWLAELRPACNVPHYVIGMLNYRGKVIPVMDLNVRMGQSPMRYKITDKIIVIGMKDASYGLIVSDVQDVGTIAEGDMEDINALSDTNVYMYDFVTAFAKIRQEVIMLLDYKRLIQCDRSLQGQGHPDVVSLPEDATTTDKGYFIACASEHHRDIYLKRATNLLLVKKHDYVKQSMSLAVVSINDEHFGLEIKSADAGKAGSDIPSVSKIVEFSRVRDVRVIPCCPGHIVGSMNLHGEILTLIDVRGALNLTAATSYANARVVVIQVEDMVVGVVIDDVIDVVYPRQGDIINVSVSEYSTAERYFKGTIRYGERLLPIVDLHKLLTGGDLVVNEES
ncbi:chemotaxis protein CheW [Candidatus Magnetobacterium casense]|uniref:Chemotaxis protein CheW n=1 Tax=Candidatus Magnetobacterium casense TaxID=1455061 RepID=A0ABS6RV85_9BACT|nr:chemotaxis protein CheW [Candidatus Magnetobacterium casensis]MBV6340544.1 chemotaxis protein CheW [Candidatus Magnetobacterium casensis]